MNEYDVLRTKNTDKLKRLNLPDIDLEPLKVLIWEVEQPREVGGLVKFSHIYPPSEVKTAHGTNVAEVIQTGYKGPVSFYLFVGYPKIAEVIDFAIANGIRIINASIGIPYNSDYEIALKKYAEWGGIVVAAAGNNGSNPVHYPAKSPYALAVSATNVEDSDGPEIDVTADSLWVVKYANGLYDSFNGTSCATPVMSACVGYMFAVHPEWKLADVINFINENSVTGKEEHERIFSFPDNFGGEEMAKKYIVLHHSAGADGIARDFDAMKKYHMEHNGWRDIGYHWVVERINGVLTAIPGRAESDTGAHCPGRNVDGIGVCLVGDFTNAPPDEEQYAFVAKLCKGIMARHPIQEIGGHRDYYATACPGNMYDVEKVKSLVKGVVDVTKALEVPAWKQEIMDRAKMAGLIDANSNHNPDDPAPKWFVLDVVLDALKAK